MLSEFNPNTVCPPVIPFQKLTVLFLWTQVLGDCFFLALEAEPRSTHTIILQCIMLQRAWDGVKRDVGRWINQAFPNNYFFPLVIASDFKKTVFGLQRPALRGVNIMVMLQMAKYSFLD